MPLEKRPYKPRLVVEITPEQHHKLQQLFPHGFLKPFFSVVVDEVIELIEVGGKQALGLIIAKAIMPSDLLTSLEDLKEGGNQDGNSGKPEHSRCGEDERGGSPSPTNQETVEQEEATEEGG